MSDINTYIIGNVVLEFPVLSSTNDYAVELLAKTKPVEGTVISAGYQEAGRGQIGSAWHSAAGQNLLLSIILYPRWLAVSRQFALSQALSLGLCEALDTLLAGHLVQVKWPNDIYVNGKKVAGMLIQNSLSGVYLQWSVAGIGLNVNELSFPPGLGRPTSLAWEAGHQPFDRAQVQAVVLAALDRRYRQLRSGSWDTLQADYLARLYQYGQPAQYRRTATGALFEGVISGLAESGKLGITHQGGEEWFEVKEIVFCAP